MTGSHLPLDYRGEFEEQENRFGPPAQICDTCSDFENGQLVPVSFCSLAAEAAEQLEEWLQGRADKPIWLDSLDVMIARF